MVKLTNSCTLSSNYFNNVYFAHFDLYSPSYSLIKVHLCRHSIGVLFSLPRPAFTKFQGNGGSKDYLKLGTDGEREEEERGSRNSKRELWAERKLIREQQGGDIGRKTHIPDIWIFEDISWIYGGRKKGFAFSFVFLRPAAVMSILHRYICKR